MVRDDISGLDIFQAFVAVKNRVFSFNINLLCCWSLQIMIKLFC
jgi:hypothetical protein